MMSTSNRPLMILTLLVVLSGLSVVLFRYFGEVETSFPTVSAYETARRDSEIPKDAPSLPGCAETIAVTAYRKKVTTLSFMCTDAGERLQFINAVKSEFMWNVLLEGNQVTLTTAAAK